CWARAADGHSIVWFLDLLSEQRPPWPRRRNALEFLGVLLRAPASSRRGSPRASAGLADQPPPRLRRSAEASAKAEAPPARRRLRSNVALLQAPPAPDNFIAD